MGSAANLLPTSSIRKSSIILQLESEKWNADFSFLFPFSLATKPIAAALRRAIEELPLGRRERLGLDELDVVCEDECFFPTSSRAEVEKSVNTHLQQTASDLSSSDWFERFYKGKGAQEDLESFLVEHRMVHALFWIYRIRYLKGR